MGVITKKISLETKGNTDIIDITDRVKDIVASEKIKNGTVTVFVPGSTGAITTIEYESGLIKDLKRMFQEVASQEKEYAHNLAWGDGNGHSHVRAALIGPSLTVPLIDKSMELGTWQQIILIDFDNRSRSRNLIVQIVGE